MQNAKISNLIIKENHDVLESIKSAYLVLNNFDEQYNFSMEEVGDSFSFLKPAKSESDIVSLYNAYRLNKNIHFSKCEIQAATIIAQAVNEFYEGNRLSVVTSGQGKAYRNDANGHDNFMIKQTFTHGDEVVVVKGVVVILQDIDGWACESHYDGELWQFCIDGQSHDLVGMKNGFEKLFTELMEERVYLPDYPEKIEVDAAEALLKSSPVSKLMSAFEQYKA
jgi:hypothetical protein